RAWSNDAKRVADSSRGATPVVVNCGDREISSGCNRYVLRKDAEAESISHKRSAAQARGGRGKLDLIATAVETRHRVTAGILGCNGDAESYMLCLRARDRGDIEVVYPLLHHDTALLSVNGAAGGGDGPCSHSLKRRAECVQTIVTCNESVVRRQHRSRVRAGK